MNFFFQLENLLIESETEKLISKKECWKGKKTAIQVAIGLFEIFFYPFQIVQRSNRCNIFVCYDY